MRLYFYFLLIILLVGCIHPLDIETKYRYEDLSKQIDSSLTNHFDLVENRFNHASFKYPNTYRNDGLAIIFFIPNIKGNFKTAQLLKDKSVGAVGVDSDCKLIVDRPSSNTVYKESNCEGQIYPIPDYLNWWGGSQFIPSDLMFYILDYKGGRFLPDSLLTSGGGMPEELKNGFSKGFALSEKKKKVVFWLLVW